jgi:hypothetical protein
MAINREKLARLEAHTEAMNLQQIALSEMRRSHITEARRLLAQATANAPDAQHLRVADLNRMDAAELTELGVDLSALRAANLEHVGAAEMEKRLDAERKATHPMRVLMDKLRRYAREGLSFSD